MPRSVKGTVQGVSRDLERLLVGSRTRTSDVAGRSDTLTDDQDEEEEELVATGSGGNHQDLCQNAIEEIPNDVTRQSNCRDSIQVQRTRQGEVTVGGPAAPQNTLETSVIDLCDESVLSTNNETVLEVSQGEDSELVDNIGPSSVVPEETILIDDDEDENENEMLRVQEVVNMFEAQVRAYNTRVDTTIVLSESEEEQEHEEEQDESAEGGTLDETLNILTIKCPICLAGFREIQAEGKVSNCVSDQFKCSCLGGSLCSTICGHIFCKSCLDGCSTGGVFFKCPSCRRSLRDNDYHPIFLS